MPSRRAVLVSTLAAGPASGNGGCAAPSDPGVSSGLGSDDAAAATRTIGVNRKSASVFGIRQPDGTFGIRTEVGTPFRVRVENEIDQPSLIHWHGLAPPWRQDGCARHLRAADPAGRQRRLRLPAELWRDILHAFPSGTAGAVVDGGAADHPRQARPAGSARSRGDAQRSQLYAARADFRKFE